MARRGLEPVRSPSSREPLIVRARVVEQQGWISLSVEDLDAPDACARFLARVFDAPALGAWFWDGESRLVLTLFEGRAPAARLSLPESARRSADGRVAVPLGKLSRLVPGVKPKKTGLDVLVRAEEASFDAKGRCEYAPEEVAHALGRAFGIGDLFIDPLDEDAGDEVLHFRPEPTSDVAKRARAEREAEDDARRADHEGRLYTVGWLAFDVAPRDIAAVLAKTARPVVEALAAHLGSRALTARAIVPRERDTPLPAPTEREAAWKTYARALREGAFVDLRHEGAPVLAAAWLVLRGRALVVGWCMRGLKDPAKRAALAASMNDALAISAEDARCFGALIACQKRPMSLEQQALAYEYLRGRSALAIRPDAHRARARAPGWRVLVPSGAPALRGSAPSGFSARVAKAGTVIEASASDPHELAPGAIDALEKYLDPTLAR